MDAKKRGTLNWLQYHLPEGLIVDAAWLERHGYYSPLRNRYLSSGWLKQPAKRVYRRPPGALGEAAVDDRLRWQHVVISLQTLLELPLVVGGRTALESQGFAHYLGSRDLQEVHLYGGKRPPGWLSKLPLENRFVFHNANRLFRSESRTPGDSRSHRNRKSDSTTTLDRAPLGCVQQRWGPWGWPLTMSTPERAILELLDEVPHRETFHQADVLVEGLRNLSPRRLNSLLGDCRSIKVKRLFLWFADRHNHSWAKHLERERVDLGRGKRMLVRGGRLDRHYQITVPEDIDAGG